MFYVSLTLHKPGRVLSDNVQVRQIEYSLPVSAHETREETSYYHLLYHGCRSMLRNCDVFCMSSLSCMILDLATDQIPFQGNVFLCTPISDFWNIELIFMNKMNYINIFVMDSFTNCWSAFEDLIIWALPIYVLWNLKVPTSRKGLSIPLSDSGSTLLLYMTRIIADVHCLCSVGLYILIGISFLSVVCAIVRIASFVIWINSSDTS